MSTSLAQFSKALYDIAVSLDGAFKNIAFIHADLNFPLSQPAACDVAAALLELNQLQRHIAHWSPESQAEVHRQAYFMDFIRSVQAQVQVFILEEKLPMREAVEAINGIVLPGPFQVVKDVENLHALASLHGIASPLAQVVGGAKREFYGLKDLKSFCHQVVANATLKCQPFLDESFGPEIAEALRKSRIIFEQCDDSNDISHYYAYESPYNGKVALAMEGEFDECSLVGFLHHECMPGHHLFYCARQLEIEKHPEDPLLGLDMFYSPESVINEGIATNSEMFFPEVMSSEVFIMTRLEKVLFRIFYNLWHAEHIQRKDTGYCFELLRHALGVPESVIEGNMEQFAGPLRYYMPVYPVGCRLVEQLAIQHGKGIFRTLFRQNSYGILSGLLVCNSGAVLCHQGA